MTVLEVIQKSADFLARREVDSPRLQAELLLAHVLKMPRMKLYLNFERALSEAEANQLRDLVMRRGQREPVQHIIGSTSFCGLEIAVNRQVFVPRPETELLAEAGWTFLESLVTAQSDIVPTALDLGTGSGCIAIALAAKSPRSQITAVDISEEALAVARHNAANAGCTERVIFLKSDLLREVPPGTVFDLIISNPPYIPAEEIPSLQAEVRDFDPHGALDGGADGLNFYRRLAVEAVTSLKPQGRLMFEFGDGQATDLEKIMQAQNWIVEEVRRDYSQRQRILIARR